MPALCSVASSGSNPPCTVPEDVSTIEGVDGRVVVHSGPVLAEDSLPAAEQRLVLDGKRTDLLGIVKGTQKLHQIPLVLAEEQSKKI